MQATLIRPFRAAELPSGQSPARIAALVVAGAALVRWASPPWALLGGLAFAFVAGNPLARHSRILTKYLLQACVVLLGFGMDLPAVLRAGRDGALFAAASIAGTLLLGRWLAAKFRLEGKTGALIAIGTAICGGSAIAAVSTVIGATEAQIAVSIGTIFLLNAAALYLFPLVGHLLHLSGAQFGLWAGIAIHDISSVVGAALSYGSGALPVATAVKLSRTLWIIPVTLVLALRARRHPEQTGAAESAARPAGAAMPWFVGFFLVASLLRSLVPAVAECAPLIGDLARRGMILVLFLIGTSLSFAAIKSVGWRILVTGLLLWLVVSAGSLAVIRL